MPSVLTSGPGGPGTLPDVIDEHTRHTARLLVERSVVIANRVKDGSCAVVGLNYTLAHGRARLLEVIGRLEKAG